ncbi:uncharacterized protein LOC113770442 [Coffea eugenioides]|uniref:Uncharacterized protein n=1 Tax=Coffea arabica TaxID=13443 RepID=A0ABM4UAV3_COFAR|nr:uncharacterized protein LOC113770442 [Coffea eugenioides]
MPSETTHTSSKSHPNLDGAPPVEMMHKRIDEEIGEMVSALTNRLNSILHAQKVEGGSSSSHHHRHHQEEDQEHGGARIITLAGNNVGATMRREMDEKTADLPVELPMGEQEALSTYVNSNFQAVNNSIMMGGSYSTNDPGVHLTISDYMEDWTPSESKHKAGSKHDGKKEKKKQKASQSDQQTEKSE